MRKDKLQEKRRRTAEQLESLEKKVSLLRKEIKEIDKEIREIDETEVIVYVRQLGISPEKAKEVIAAFAAEKNRDE